MLFKLQYAHWLTYVSYLITAPEGREPNPNAPSNSQSWEITDFYLQPPSGLFTPHIRTWRLCPNKEHCEFYCNDSICIHHSRHPELSAGTQTSLSRTHFVMQVHRCSDHIHRHLPQLCCTHLINPLPCRHIRYFYFLILIPIPKYNSSVDFWSKIGRGRVGKECRL